MKRIISLLMALVMMATGLPAYAEEHATMEELLSAEVEELITEVFIAPKDGMSITVEDVQGQQVSAALQYDAQKRPGITLWSGDEAVALDTQALYLRMKESTQAARLTDIAAAWLLKQTGLSALPQVEATDLDTLRTLLGVLVSGISEEAVQWQQAEGEIILQADAALLQRDLTQAVTTLLADYSGLIDPLLERYGEVLHLLIPALPATCQELLALWKIALLALPQAEARILARVTWGTDGWLARLEVNDTALEAAWQGGRFLLTAEQDGEKQVLADSKDWERLVLFLQDVYRGISTASLQYGWTTAQSEDDEYLLRFDGRLDTIRLRGELEKSILACVAQHADTLDLLGQRYGGIFHALLYRLDIAVRDLRGVISQVTINRLRSLIRSVQVNSREALASWLVTLVRHIPDYRIDVEFFQHPRNDYGYAWMLNLEVNGVCLSAQGDHSSLSAQVGVDSAFTSYYRDDQGEWKRSEWQYQLYSAMLDVQWKDGFSAILSVGNGERTTTASLIGTAEDGNVTIQARTSDGTVDLTFALSGNRGTLTGAFDRKTIDGSVVVDNNSAMFILKADGDTLLDGIVSVSNQGLSLTANAAGLLLRAAYVTSSYAGWQLQAAVGDFVMTLQHNSYLGETMLLLPRWRVTVADGWNKRIQVIRETGFDDYGIPLTCELLLEIDRWNGMLTARYTDEQGLDYGLSYTPWLVTVMNGLVTIQAADVTHLVSGCFHAAALTRLQKQPSSGKTYSEQWSVVTHQQGDGFTHTLYRGMPESGEYLGRMTVDFAPDTYQPMEPDRWLTLEELRENLQ